MTLDDKIQREYNQRFLRDRLPKAWAAPLQDLGIQLNKQIGKDLLSKVMLSNRVWISQEGLECSLDKASMHTLESLSTISLSTPIFFAS